jgi:hypothetical protein
VSESCAEQRGNSSAAHDERQHTTTDPDEIADELEEIDRNRADDCSSPSSRGRATKRRRVSVKDDSDDQFGLDPATQQAMLEDGMSLYMVFVMLWD